MRIVQFYQDRYAEKYNSQGWPESFQQQMQQTHWSTQGEQCELRFTMCAAPKSLPAHLHLQVRAVIMVSSSTRGSESVLKSNTTLPRSFATQQGLADADGLMLLYNAITAEYAEPEDHRYGQLPLQ